MAMRIILGASRSRSGGQSASLDQCALALRRHRVEGLSGRRDPDATSGYLFFRALP